MSSTHATGIASLPASEAGDEPGEGSGGMQGGRLARAHAAAMAGWVALRKLLGKQEEEPFDALSGGMNPLVRWVLHAVHAHQQAPLPPRWLAKMLSPPLDQARRHALRLPAAHPRFPAPTSSPQQPSCTTL